MLMLMVVSWVWVVARVMWAWVMIGRVVTWG